MQRIPGVADAHIVQVLDYPDAADRRRPPARRASSASSQRDVANNMLTSLSSQSLVAPTYFLNPQNNVNYIVAVQTPIEQIKSVGDLLDTADQSAAAAGIGRRPRRRGACRVRR